jgi:LemA protein
LTAYIWAKGERLKKGLIILVGLFGLLFFAGITIYGIFVGTQHSLVQKDEAVKAAWSQVDINLQRRADLIPNLVETVKGYAKEETTVFGDIANARAGLLNAHTPQDKMAANGHLDSAFGRLLALKESYPELKSNAQFMRLQDELAGTENRIAVSRRGYNQTLKDYNTYVREFPASFLAWMLGFATNEAYFEASASSRSVPNVKF